MRKERTADGFLARLRRVSRRPAGASILGALAIALALWLVLPAGGGMSTHRSVAGSSPRLPGEILLSRASQATGPPSGRRGPVTMPKASAPASIVHYTALVGLTFTRSPSDPYNITYQYAAGATRLVNGRRVDLGANGQLPSGVLRFYTPLAPQQMQGLICSMNVGGSVTGGSCAVEYKAGADYTVSAQYMPQGAKPVSGSAHEQITPFSFAPGSVVGEELDNNQATPCTTQCIQHLTFRIRSAVGPNHQSAKSNGVVTILWDGVTFVAPPGQNVCHVASTSRSDPGAQTQTTTVLSPDCSQSPGGPTGPTQRSMTYTVPGYAVVSLARQASVPCTCLAEFEWSN